MEVGKAGTTILRDMKTNTIANPEQRRLAATMHNPVNQSTSLQSQHESSRKDVSNILGLTGW
ncbi:hypothetical protein O9K51_11151 [Purpureocillium lavendulum]|uniref:Uncharacterized protein n=1 Tax=Purpureocillium lavendulum TaxID=1247861 RepID=A0AB34FAZ5_9HYPO|nr:hypothetical protein O9K51_11151 [Purpureocillium lavendulum]